MVFGCMAIPHHSLHMFLSILKRYTHTWWLPSVVYLIPLVGFAATAIGTSDTIMVLSQVLFYLAALAFLGVIAAMIVNFVKKRRRLGFINLLLLFGCGVASMGALAFVLFFSMFGPSEDGFADNLTIPAGIEMAEPDPDTKDPFGDDETKASDAFQLAIRKAAASPGNNKTDFTPSMPSLRQASTHHSDALREYVEASPDWHVFMDQGHRFAARCWSYDGEPRHTLHGYISRFGDDSGFQTRCLLCLDRKQWSHYEVQHVAEGSTPVQPEMTQGNQLDESRVMIDCGGIWVEIFEQSNNPERRVTKATISQLEKEFSEFLKAPEAAVKDARLKARELVTRMAGDDKHPFRLVSGMQPGIYEVVYSINPGEPGSVYLKAFEITKGTPLSTDRLKEQSATRMTWSADTSERFGAKAGFTIYEGDWGKPYAARFEVWLTPDSGKPERKLAERIYKIEGWQR